MVLQADPQPHRKRRKHVKHCHFRWQLFKRHIRFQPSSSRNFDQFNARAIVKLLSIAERVKCIFGDRYIWDGRAHHRMPTGPRTASVIATGPIVSAYLGGVSEFDRRRAQPP